MRKHESPRTRELCQQVKDRGWFYACLSGGSVFQTTGLPDRLFACCDAEGRRWTGLVEFKAHGGELKTDQRLHLRAIRRCDPRGAYVVRLGPREGDPMTVEDEDGNALAVVPREDGVLMLETIMRLR